MRHQATIMTSMLRKDRHTEPASSSSANARNRPGASSLNRLGLRRTMMTSQVIDPLPTALHSVSTPKGEYYACLRRRPSSQHRSWT
jgi:hypothetical protein